MKRVFTNYEKLKQYIGADGIYSRYADDELRNHLECIGSNTGWFELEIENNVYTVEVNSYEVGIEEYKYSFILNINQSFIENETKRKILKKLINKYGEIRFHLGELFRNELDTENLKDDLEEIENNTFEDIKELIISISYNKTSIELFIKEIELYGKYKEQKGKYVYIGSDNEYELNKKWAELQYKRIQKMLHEI